MGTTNIPLRNLGKQQMATDNAVYAAKKIISGTSFEDIKFIDKVEIEVEEGGSVILPFRYALEEGKPLISKELVEYIKKRKGL